MKIDNKLIVDPNLEEERIADARFTIVLTKAGKVCAIQKSGDGTFTPEEILEAEKIARKKSEEIRKKFYPEQAS
jgi:exosome complex component RRP42